MTFENEKKTYLAKMDKSKKGEIDEKIKPLLAVINALPDHYTTSSCSGRVYLWSGSGKKNETQRLRVSHDLIDVNFLNFFNTEDSGLIWLRLEGMILHVACRDLAAANLLLENIKKIYKKSCILSASNKIIVEIRGSELMEMPLYEDGKLLFCGDVDWLVRLINQKIEGVWMSSNRLEEMFQEHKLILN